MDLRHAIQHVEREQAAQERHLSAVCAGLTSSRLSGKGQSLMWITRGSSTPLTLRTLSSMGGGSCTAIARMNRMACTRGAFSALPNTLSACFKNLRCSLSKGASRGTEARRRRRAKASVTPSVICPADRLQPQGLALARSSLGLHSLPCRSCQHCTPNAQLTLYLCQMG